MVCQRWQSFCYRKQRHYGRYYIRCNNGCKFISYMVEYTTLSKQNVRNNGVNIRLSRRSSTERRCVFEQLSTLSHKLHAFSYSISQFSYFNCKFEPYVNVVLHNFQHSLANSTKYCLTDFILEIHFAYYNYLLFFQMLRCYLENKNEIASEHK